MNLLDALSVLAGLVVLVVGGESLVRGASALALKLGMTPLVVGLTVVAFATSAPELAVTLGSVLRGEPDLAVGNVVGSNIANVLLILGVSALVLPLLVKSQLVRVDIPFMVAFSVLLLLLALDGQISTIDGLVLFVLLILYLTIEIITGRRKGNNGEGADSVGAREADLPDTVDASAATASEDASAEVMAQVAPPSPLWRDLLALIAGVALLVLGANLLVSGAVGIAKGFGVSELVIGLTVVAIGTSLPELATAVVAVRRGERDLAVGNVVGSNIFNIGAVLGLGAIISPVAIPIPEAAIALDLPLMVATAAVLLPIAFTGFRISRTEGAIFLGLYVAYTAFLLLSAAEHAALRGFTAVMLFFVLPLLGLGVLGAVVFEIGKRRRAGEPMLHPPEQDEVVPDSTK